LKTIRVCNLLIQIWLLHFDMLPIDTEVRHFLVANVLLKDLLPHSIIPCKYIFQAIFLNYNDKKEDVKNIVVCQRFWWRLTVLLQFEHEWHFHLGLFRVFITTVLVWAICSSAWKHGHHNLFCVASLHTETSIG
jgi:hypothetical protein